MTPWVRCKNALLRTGEQWFARRSLARTIILSIGLTLVTMQLIVTSIDVVAARRGIEALSAKRAGAALDMLTAVHTQAMLNRAGTGDSDPAIATLNGSMRQFSRLSQDVQLWVVMGPKVRAYQHGARAGEIELPRDRTDQLALSTARDQLSEHGDRLRLSRPVLAGSGSASAAACAGCHQDLMGIGRGEVIGVYSAEVDMRPELARWRIDARDRVLAALATTAATLALISLLLHLTTLRPLARLSRATRKLAYGDLEADVTDTERPDALGDLARALTVFRLGLTEKRSLETRNAFLARHDSLTSLPNRASFSDHLDDALILAGSRGRKVGVIGIDLNRFKEINDRHGHAVGDEVLKVLAGRMSALLTEGEFVARFGGDEFAAAKTFSKASELTDFATRLERALFEVIRLETLELPSGASLGVAIFPDDALTRDPLLSNADLAMYRAKASHGSRPVCYYEPAMDEAARHRRQMASDLKSALERGQFSLHYQVQKAVATGEVVGYEALLRWAHPEQGSIPPAVFIGVAEECGAILDIGEWVLRTACLEAAQWPSPHRVAVNLSPAQLLQPDLVQRIHAILLDSGLPPRRLELEITESMVISDKVHALHVLRQIKALGISVAMDDFGTGYASLDTLNAFPFDKIKIDRSFLAEAGQRPQARSIIRAILALGRSLDIPVLAEGVETEEQLALLDAEGCREAQGYLFGRPRPMAEILALATEAPAAPDVRISA